MGRGAACPSLGRLAVASQTFPRQGEIWWVNLDPTVGQEISKRRPALVVSPDDMNAHQGTVLVAPITPTHKPWPTRLPIALQPQGSSVALDQMRVLDRSRLVSRIEHTDPEPALAVLRDMFASN